MNSTVHILDGVNKVNTIMRCSKRWQILFNVIQKKTKLGYIECKCKHRSSDGQVGGKSKEHAKEGAVYAVNISQGRKDVQSRSDIQENGSRGHKSNSLNTPRCTMYFTIKHDDDKSRWYVTVGSGCANHYGHKQKSANEMAVKKRSVQ